MKNYIFKKKDSAHKNTGLLRFFVFMTMTLGILAIAFFSYFANQEIDISKMSFKEFVHALQYGNQDARNTQLLNEMYFDAGSNPAYAVYREYIVEASKYSIRFVDKKLKEHSFEAFAMNQPMVKTDGIYLVVADMGGKDLVVFNGSQRLWHKTLENTIMSVDINRNGYVLVVHAENRYKSAVTLFDIKGEQIFTLGKAENYIAMAKISPTGESLVFNAMNASNIKINSILEFADIQGRFAENSIQLENTIITHLGYLHNGVIAALGDTGLKFYAPNKKEKATQKIEGNLFGGCIVDGRYVAVAASEEENQGVYNQSKSRVNIYEEGDLEGTFQLQEHIRNLSAARETIALNTGRSVYFIDVEGKYLGRFDGKQEITNVVFFDDQHALLVGKSLIQIIKIL